jgi:hypothetical protein
MEALRAHEKVWPFLDPVDREQVPDYYDVIKSALACLCFVFLVDWFN